MNEYVAWVAPLDRSGGFMSVKRGTLKAVKTYAESVLRSETWRVIYQDGGIVRVTRGSNQAFVTSYEVR